MHPLLNTDEYANGLNMLNSVLQTMKSSLRLMAVRV